MSPFLDKRHGTERCVAEQIDYLAENFEIHVYSSAVEDLDLSKIVWHRVPRLPGPHLARYLWFVAANHFRRWLDRRFRKLDFDLVFSPGINCFDADIIAVHIVFAETYRLIRQDLSLFHNPVQMWPWLIHRKLSYLLFIELERRIYTRTELPLAVISHKMEADLARCFNRKGGLFLVYHGVDLEHMNPVRRQSLRQTVRETLKIPDDAFAILLVGNDWKKKGLPCLIEAVINLQNPNIWILVRGKDDSSSFLELIRKHAAEIRIVLLPSVAEIEEYYAAADLYVGPSLEDSFAIPPLEAMACGLPVIVSRQTGMSELLTHGVDGFILDDPRDSRVLGKLIESFYGNSDFRNRVGLCATATARRYTWQRNAAKMRRLFEDHLREKAHRIDEDAPSTQI